ncbi:Lrp/AsnC ligand binding domain-containing protein [Marihabitans asiaticum]|uniref:AsnC-like helix-turn-helix protein n=1 Tax=Marihabitans asiaticum TaxID=415218 RepID=A0A560W9I8_9MICO|nr:Lrp/AsnC ligand binding domain-containing protein [Marihabitans asiaticum]TWD14296.1 AsnC-like helix-turn-helix protein [Marihabitans asiaticum]
MVHAFVLIQTDVGRSTDVRQALSEIDGVAEAKEVTGPYDVVAQLEAGSMDDLGRLVLARVQQVEGITRTLTCPVVEA